MTNLSDNWKSGTHRIMEPPAPGTWREVNGLNHRSGMFSLRPHEQAATGRVVWLLTATCTGLLAAVFNSQALAMSAAEDLLKLGDWRTLRDISQIGKAAAQGVVEMYHGTLATGAKKGRTA